MSRALQASVVDAGASTSRDTAADVAVSTDSDKQATLTDIDGERPFVEPQLTAIKPIGNRSPMGLLQ